MREKKLDVGGEFGDYRVVKVLGASGAVDVYLMRSVTTGRFYAMKLFMPPEGMTDETRQRFIGAVNEARRLHGENLVEIHDFGIDPLTGLYYIIMDYADGGTLAEYVAANGALDVAEALKTAIVAAGALETVHGAGMLHGKVTPGNIMFMQDGTLKLTDAGLYKALPIETAANISPFTAPEHVMHGKKVDCRADVFSLGVVLFEMLTGRRLAAVPSMLEMIVKTTNNELVPDVRTVRGDVPAVVAEAVSRMCAPEAQDRPQSARAAAELLLAALKKIGGLEESADRSEAASTGTRKVRRVKIRLPKDYPAVAAAMENNERESGGIGKLFAVLVLLGLVAAGLFFALKKGELGSDAAQPQVVGEDVNDSTVRTAQAGGFTWFYTVEHSKAVLWRGFDGLHGEPCLEPAPSGRVVVPAELDGFKVGAIGALAFNACGDLTEIVFPETLESIGNRAFINCGSLMAVVLPPSVKSIGKWAFNSCRALKIVDLANCAEIVDEGGNFAFCPELEEFAAAADNPSFKTPGGVLYSADGKRLLAYPAKSEEVEIPDGVEEIGAYAFCESTARTIAVPASVARIGQGAFENCRSLKEVTFAGDAPALLPGEDGVFKGADRQIAVVVDNGKRGWPRQGAKWPQRDGRSVKCAFAEFSREWRDAKGRTKEATLVGIAEGGTVAMMRNSGEDRVRSLTISKLSEADRAFIASVRDKLRKYVKHGDRYQEE